MPKGRLRRVGTLIVVVVALTAGGCRGCAPGARSTAPKKLRIGLALSGGGYRAALHALGLLHVLHERRLLDQVEVVSSVSGSSITAGLYAYRRAREGAAFNFAAFEHEALTAIGTYEVPRTVLAAEMQTQGSAALTAFTACALARGGAWNGFEEMLARCGSSSAQEFNRASLEQALAAFTGDTCSESPDAVSRCVDGEGASLSSHITQGGLRLLLGPDSSNDVRRSLCRLKQRRCRLAGFSFLTAHAEGGHKPAVHPFADLLHLALYTPWRPQQTDVRMSELARVGTRFVFNAASTHVGELWTATAGGAGVRERTQTPAWRPPTWHAYGASAGPRLADVVAASACYPLFCRPLEDPTASADPNPETLTDGGLHDNLGLAGLEQLSEAERLPLDLVVVADAHRPFSDARDQPESRLGVLARAPDLLIEQRSSATLKQAAARPRTCPLVHVSLAPTQTVLASLPTDLRPIDNPQARLNESVALIQQKLAGNPCLRGFPTGRR